MLNHNILNKIYHKRWLEGLKQVNTEYHQNYVYYDETYYIPCLIHYPYEQHKTDFSTYLEDEIIKIMYYGGSYLFSSKDPLYTRMPTRMSLRGIQFKKYLRDKMIRHVSVINYQYSLSNNYIYSSGLHHPNGYKG